MCSRPVPTSLPTISVACGMVAQELAVTAPARVERLALLWHERGVSALDGSDLSFYLEAWHFSVSHIYGGEGNDTLTAGRGGDYVSGENGNDSLVDLPQRNTGTKDYLYGGAGNDSIDGRDGPDELNGNSGTDMITGGAGKDHIYANDGEVDQVACGGNGDVLYADTITAVKDLLYSC
jgi:Ca2+-binding RTX toxin-like protein